MLWLTLRRYCSDPLNDDPTVIMSKRILKKVVTAYRQMLTLAQFVPGGDLLSTYLPVLCLVVDGRRPEATRCHAGGL